MIRARVRRGEGEAFTRDDQNLIFRQSFDGGGDVVRYIG